MAKSPQNALWQVAKTFRGFGATHQGQTAIGGKVESTCGRSDRPVKTRRSGIVVMTCRSLHNSGLCQLNGVCLKVRKKDRSTGCRSHFGRNFFPWTYGLAEQSVWCIEGRGIPSHCCRNLLILLHRNSRSLLPAVSTLRNSPESSTLEYNLVPHWSVQVGCREL